MQSHLQVEAHGEDTGQVVGEIFRSMLGIEVVPTEAAQTRETELLSAAVYFAGAWKGALLVECTPEQAFEFTRCLMSIERPAAIDDDVRDAMGELANMIAGNLKPLLPHGVCLSMPSVVEGTDYLLSICKGCSVSRLAFDSAFGPFWVTLAARPEKG
jgi:chemotaxis protein CheX